jgi:hypothetical protein
MHLWRALSLMVCFFSLPQAAVAQSQKQPLPPVLRQVFTGTFLQSATEQQLGTVVDANFDNLIIKPGDHVRVRCRAACNVSVGDSLYAFAQSGTIKNPMSHHPMGVITEATGLLIVTEVLDGFVWAKVAQSFMEIERGQGVAKLAGPLFQDIVPKRPTVSLQGHVLAIAHALLLGGQQRALFVDVGRAQGLDIGDTLTIMGRRDTTRTPLPEAVHKEAMAEVVLIAVGEHASTALIANGLWEVALGDVVIAAPL